MSKWHPLLPFVTFFVSSLIGCGKIESDVSRLYAIPEKLKHIVVKIPTRFKLDTNDHSREKHNPQSLCALPRDVRIELKSAPVQSADHKHIKVILKNKLANCEMMEGYLFLGHLTLVPQDQVVGSLPNIELAPTLAERARKAKTRIMMAQSDANATSQDVKWSHFDGVYNDSNGNSLQDAGDAGYFEPGSTIKIAVAAIYLETFPQDISNSSTLQLIKKMLVISDNDATNLLVKKIGLKNFNQRLAQVGLSKTHMGRYMGEKSVSFASPCRESLILNGGNCSTASDLIGVHMRLSHPAWFTTIQQFQLSEAARTLLQRMLSQTPYEAGFDKPDDYCRFSQKTFVSVILPIDKNAVLQSKCGVSPSLTWWSDSSHLQRSNGSDVFYTIAIQKTNFSDAQAYELINALAAALLKTE